ncbi:prepilin peptidase [Bhargavaea cecembensis]|uniref:prepilin peptidase n=1 Tax=Bhargavaea cecembensis TaxID=394098 RepID=UPI00058EA1D7|nr:A24 family peptidase [Bhargavaea cecembensis]
MTWLWAAMFFIYGLVFGSFFNVVGLRVPKGESIVRPPSHCPNCGRRLTAADLVPFFSFVFLKGKCRGCGSKIQWVYPVMELLTGISFALSFLRFGFSGELIVALLFMSLLVIITVSDLAYMLIPDKFLLLFGVPLAVLRVALPLDPWWDSVAAAIVLPGVLLVTAIVSKGGMGGGDIKLYVAIGIVLGTVDSFLSLFFAALLGAVFGIIHLRRQGKGRRTPIPFGPWIALGAAIAYLYGDAIVGSYVNLFF